MKIWYATLSIMTFNTMVATVIFLCLLWGMLEIRHVITGKGNVVISESIKFESFGLTTMEKAKATASEFDSYASQHPFVFNPWTTFMLAPVTGVNLNVIVDPLINHRATPIEENQSVSRTDNVITIWCFGGSTLYGFGVPDDQTISSHLGRVLGNLDKSKQYQIVNFGQPYWYSSVEVAGFGALLRSGRKPDIVLFLDGLNDMANLVAGRTTPYFTDRANAAWERTRSDARRLISWITVNESFPITRILRFVESQTGSISTSDAVFRRTTSMTSDEVVRVYLTNIKMANALSDAFGVQAHFFLQPVPWYGKYVSKKVSRSFPFGNRDIAIDAYDKIISFHSKQANAHSLHDALYVQKSPFVDNFHYSDTSNRLLAKKIAEVISKTIE